MDEKENRPVFAGITIDHSHFVQMFTQDYSSFPIERVSFLQQDENRNTPKKKLKNEENEKNIGKKKVMSFFLCLLSLFLSSSLAFLLFLQVNVFRRLMVRWTQVTVTVTHELCLLRLFNTLFFLPNFLRVIYTHSCSLLFSTLRCFIGGGGVPLFSYASKFGSHFQMLASRPAFSRLLSFLGWDKASRPGNSKIRWVVVV